MLAIAIIGLYRASQMSVDEHFEPPSVPGFDGLQWNGETFRNFNGVLIRPNYVPARNLINIFSYFLIFSIATGFLGMRLSETSITRRNFPRKVNPALLLIPSAISVISILYPLSVWTLRTLYSIIKLLIKENLKFSILLDACRLSFLPIILVWAVYIYFLYGFWLGVLYYQRRGDQPSPTTNNSPFRRPIRKQTALRFQGKASVNLFSDLTAVTNELGSPSSPSSNCVISTATTSIPSTSTSSTTTPKHNRSVSPRGFRHLETVDEEAQSRTSSSD